MSSSPLFRFTLPHTRFIIISSSLFCCISHFHFPLPSTTTLPTSPILMKYVAILYSCACQDVQCINDPYYYMCISLNWHMHLGNPLHQSALQYTRNCQYGIPCKTLTYRSTYIHVCTRYGTIDAFFDKCCYCEGWFTFTLHAVPHSLPTWCSVYDGMLCVCLRVEGSNPQLYAAPTLPSSLFLTTAHWHFLFPPQYSIVGWPGCCQWVPGSSSCTSSGS